MHGTNATASARPRTGRSLRHSPNLLRATSCPSCEHVELGIRTYFESHEEDLPSGEEDAYAQGPQLWPGHQSAAFQEQWRRRAAAASQDQPPRDSRLAPGEAAVPRGRSHRLEV